MRYRFLLALIFVITQIAGYAQIGSRFELFRGYFSVGETVFVSIGTESSEMAWVQVGTTNRMNQIISLDLTTSTLTLKDQAGELYTLPLTKLDRPTQTNPAVTEVSSSHSKVLPKSGPALRLPTMEPPPDRRPTVVLEVYPPEGSARSQTEIDWDWIESDENLMRQRPLRIPVVDWRRLQSEAEKADLIELYRQHGWEVTVLRTNKSLDFNYRKLKPRKNPM